MFRNLIFFLSFLFQHKKWIRFFQFHQKSVKWFKTSALSSTHYGFDQHPHCESHKTKRASHNTHLHMYCQVFTQTRTYKKFKYRNKSFVYSGRQARTISQVAITVSLSKTHAHTHIYILECVLGVVWVYVVINAEY